MATMTQPTRDRVGNFDAGTHLRSFAERLITPRAPLSAVWALDSRGRLACHWEFYLEGRLIQLG